MFLNWFSHFKILELAIQGNAVVNKILHILTFFAIAIIKYLQISINFKSSNKGI